jgi:hypothetical protein
MKTFFSFTGGERLQVTLCSFFLGKPFIISEKDGQPKSTHLSRITNLPLHSQLMKKSKFLVEFKPTQAKQ